MGDTSVVGADRDQAIAAAKLDLNFLAALCIPDVYRFPFPIMFLAVWQMLTDSAVKQIGQDRLAIGLPRGFGKTILLKLFVVWAILFTDRRFIVIVCNTAPLAENFLSDVADILSSPNILRLFGDWRLSQTQDRLDLKKFSFRGRAITLAAMGSQSSLRGLNIKFVRPDMFVMDDMQSREEAESTVEASKILNWMLATLMKANDKQRCQFIFLGNMYPFEGSILKKIKTNAAWTTFICGAILEDGESIWPELRSVEDILDELENDTSMGHPEIFFSEVMNDEEAGTKAGIDTTLINYWKEPTNGEVLDPEGGFILIDPAVGKKKNDQISIGCHLIFSGRPVYWDLELGAFDPEAQIRKCFEMAIKYGVMAVLVESVAYQATLAFWMNKYKVQYGLHGLKILEIYPGIAAKTSRIITWLKQLVAPSQPCYLHSRVKARVVYQIVHYNPAKMKNVDDALDQGAYEFPAIAQFGAALTRPFEAHDTVKAAFGDELETSF